MPAFTLPVQGILGTLAGFLGGEYLRQQFWPSHPTNYTAIPVPASPAPALNWSLPKQTPPSTPLSITDLLDTTTITSLLAVLVILGSSYGLSTAVLKKETKSGMRVLFIWHLFDFLIHSIFEGSFLYNCFFTSAAFSADHHPSLITGFMGRPELLYGARYGDNWATKLWMVYAQADSRWGGADLTVVSLELLTVLGAGPLALWICYGITKEDWRTGFWMTVLATGELYGGFMTFAPEWLTGSPNLDTSNFMFLWVYLVFFNMLWVGFPLYALYVSYMSMGEAFGALAEKQAVEGKVKAVEVEKDT